MVESQVIENIGEPGRNRTCDPLIKSERPQPQNTQKQALSTPVFTDVADMFRIQSGIWFTVNQGASDFLGAA